jgi:hypothetical protein
LLPYAPLFLTGANSLPRIPKRLESYASVKRKSLRDKIFVKGDESVIHFI